MLRVSGPLERARAGDTVAFIELAQAHDADRAGAPATSRPLSAYVAAYRAFPVRRRAAPSTSGWRASSTVPSPAPGSREPRLLAALADALAAEAPAVAPPERPEHPSP